MAHLEVMSSEVTFHRIIIKLHLREVKASVEKLDEDKGYTKTAAHERKASVDEHFLHMAVSSYV